MGLKIIPDPIGHIGGGRGLSVVVAPVSPAPAGDFLLLEDGSYLLLESGDQILLETN